MTGVEYILKNYNGTDINIVDSAFYGFTPLLYASYKGYSAVAKLLLENKDIDVNKADQLQGLTPVYYASRLGHTEIVQMLTEKPNIDVNMADREGCTPLYMASRYGHLEIVQHLLKVQSININKANDNARTPLYMACYIGHSEIAKLLLKRPELDINKAGDFDFISKGRNALHWASSNGLSEVVNMLLERPEIEINKEDYDGSTALWLATSKENMQILLEHPKTDVILGMPDDENNVVRKIANLILDYHVVTIHWDEWLLVAALLGKAAQVNKILERNESFVNTLDSFHRTPLFWASTRGHTKLVQFLLGHDEILVNSGRSGNGATALYQSSRYGLLEIANLLLDHPTISVNSATLDRKTPLMVASLYGHSEVVERLLSVVNIDVNYAAFDGKTALIYAASAQKHGTLKLLLRCPQTDINLMDEEYKTALDRGKDMNDTESVKSFATRGTLQIEMGHTCCSTAINRGLHRAVRNEDLIWIKRFLDCPGLDINVHNKEGYTPLNLAIYKGLIEMVKIFLGDQRIDVNKLNTGHKQNALLIASDVGSIDIVKLLLFHPQTFVNLRDANGNSAQSTAVENYLGSGKRKHFRIAKILMRCPKTDLSVFTKDPEAYDSFNIRRHILEALEPSKEAKPTCCLKVKQGLIKAAWDDDFRAIKGLLKCPGSIAKLNSGDNKGRTPFYIAAMMGHVNTVETFLDDMNVDVNSGVKINGGTAFSIASEKLHFKVVKDMIIDGRLDESKGWCSDNWVHHLQPCFENKVTPQGTAPPTIHGSGHVVAVLL